MTAVAGVDLDASKAQRRNVRIHRRPGFVFRILGLVCLLGALAVGAYYAWMLWGTGLETARAQSALRTVLEDRIERRSPADLIPAVSSPEGDPAAAASFREGDPLAIIRIPRIDLDMVVVEGISTEALKKGPGHYPNSALPWENGGRVAIAGHRTTYLQPFWSLDRLRNGDLIRLFTEYGTFDYRVSEVREVPPSAAWVLDQTRSPTLVLTTCTPRFLASHRLVVIAGR